MDEDKTTFVLHKLNFKNNNKDVFNLRYSCHLNFKKHIHDSFLQCSVLIRKQG